MTSPLQRQRDGDSVQIGPDKVMLFENYIIIYAARVMPDWSVREYCRIPVYFEGRKYYLIRRTPMSKPYAMGYELTLWPEDLHEESRLAITYDEEYVARRDRETGQESFNELGRCALLPLYPFLGFLWSRTKDERLERFGFKPASITAASLMLTVAFLILEFVFLVFGRIGVLEAAYGARVRWLDLLLVLALPVDAFIRFAQLIREEPVPDGIFEWLARRARNAARRSGLKR